MMISKEVLKKNLHKVITIFKGVDNLYLKFILTIIAIVLIVIASKLPNSNDDLNISGSVSIDGSINADVSGSIDTYEQN